MNGQRGENSRAHADFRFTYIDNSLGFVESVLLVSSTLKALSYEKKTN